MKKGQRHSKEAKKKISTSHKQLKSIRPRSTTKPLGSISLKSGYQMIKTSRGYVKYSRLIMSAILGRPLTSREVVHHRDLNRANDIPANLEIMDRSDHSSLHARLGK